MRPVHVVAVLWLIQTVTILVAPTSLGDAAVIWVLITAGLLVLALRRPLSWWIAACMAWQAIATLSLIAGAVTARDRTSGLVIAATCQVGLLVSSWVALGPRHAMRQ